MGEMAELTLDMADLADEQSQDDRDSYGDPDGTQDDRRGRVDRFNPNDPETYPNETWPLLPGVVLSLPPGPNTVGNMEAVPMDTYLLVPPRLNAHRYLAPLWALPSWATKHADKTATAPAPYASRCRCCGDDVHVGDQILLAAGDVFCTRCPGGRWDGRRRVVRLSDGTVCRSTPVGDWGQPVGNGDARRPGVAVYPTGVWTGARGDLLKTFTCRWGCHCTHCRESIAVGDPILWRSNSVCRTCAIRYGFGGVRHDLDPNALLATALQTPPGSWAVAAARARGAR